MSDSAGRINRPSSQSEVSVQVARWSGQQPSLTLTPPNPTSDHSRARDGEMWRP